MKTEKTKFPLLFTKLQFSQIEKVGSYILRLLNVLIIVGKKYAR